MCVCVYVNGYFCCWGALVTVAAMQVNEEIEAVGQTTKDICKRRREVDSHGMDRVVMNMVIVL